jgi:dTDP-4-amino-4,6-dideoxygalactose transaminase
MRHAAEEEDGHRKACGEEGRTPRGIEPRARRLHGSSVVPHVASVRTQSKRRPPPVADELAVPFAPPIAVGGRPSRVQARPPRVSPSVPLCGTRRVEIPEKRMAYKVPFVKPKVAYAKYRAEIDAAWTSCLENGDLINRNQLREFEDHFAEFVGTKYCVGVNSGYHALALSMLAAGIGPGHEVITVAHTFVATISAIVHCGAAPVLVDVTPDMNMDMDAVERAITPRTKAVVPVHLNGRVCDMGKLQKLADKYRLTIIEDACQAVGGRFGTKRAGSFGAAGCWSFYPFKMLGCFGDGGAVTTNDAGIARTVTYLRYNGEDRATGEFHHHGFTALLDNVQAAVLDVKLRHLPAWIEHRRAVADRYRKGLTGVGDLVLPHFESTEYFDVFQNYVVRTHKRDELRTWLKDAGVETLVSWAKPVWHHLALRLGEHTLPETEAVCREVLSLPMSAETTFEEVDVVVDAAKRFYAR